MKLSTRETEGGPAGPGPPSADWLVDDLVRAVRLDLEDREPPVQRIVRLRREAERAAEDPVLDHDVLDLRDDVLAGLEAAAVLRACLGDRGHGDLRGSVGRRPERAERRARIVLLP